MKYLFIIFIIFFSDALMAYPHFIGFGYKSCITCHYNPFGNGAINDYGRAVAGTLISSRGFYDDKKPEELIAKETNFLFKENSQDWIRPYISYRGMYAKNNFGSNNSQSSFINMQLDANLVTRFGEKKQFISSYTFGYAPIPKAIKGTSSADSMKEYRNREYYLGYRPINEFGVYLGLFDKPFGIRVAEHNSYSRTTTLLNMNDQAHGILFHYVGHSVETGVNIFGGNLNNSSDIQMKGGSGIIEYSLNDKVRIGTSILKQKNNYLDMLASAIHFRSEIEHGISLMLESGITSKETIATNYKKNEIYSLVQNHVNIERGLYFLNSIEYYKNQTDKSYKIRLGPGLQYFPVAKIEARMDLYNTRNFNNTSSTNDRWDLMGQIHLWF